MPMTQDVVFLHMLVCHKKKHIPYKAIVDIATDLLWELLTFNIPPAWDLEANHVDIRSGVYTEAITGTKVGNVNYHKVSGAAYILIRNQIPTHMTENIAVTVITRTTVLVRCIWIKWLDCIWRLGTRAFH